MATKSTGGLGPIGKLVARRIAQARRLRGLTLHQVETQLKALGRPIPLTALSKIENGQRRVDVDDLVALAAVLEISPGELLTESGVAVESPATPSEVKLVRAQAASLPPLASGRRVRVGLMPPLADSFQERATVRAFLSESLAQGGTVVVTGMAGTGKTQLAAAYARRAWEDGVQILLWISADSRASIIRAYSEAAALLGLGSADDPDQAAQRFLVWTETTSAPWLVVLDDLLDPADARGLWPVHSPNGGAIVTTRRRDAALSAANRHMLEIAIFSPLEAEDFLCAKLGPLVGDAQAIRTLSAELGYLPLALAQAAAFMRDQHMDARAYLQLLANRRLRQALPDVSGIPDDYEQVVAAAWELSVERADRAHPAGLARPLLSLLSLLNPSGIPAVVLTSASACAYLAKFLVTPSSGSLEAENDRTPTVDAGDVSAALRVLHRFGLIDHDPRAEFHEIRVHPLIQRATRESLSTGSDALVEIVAIVSNSLLEIWPNIGNNPLQAILSSNAMALRRAVGSAILHGDQIHPVIIRAIEHLGMSGQVKAAIAEYDELLTLSKDRLGMDQPDTLTILHNRANWQAQAGDPGGAVQIFEDVLTRRLRLLGPDHRDTLNTRSSLANWRAEASDAGTAVDELRDLLADQLRILGPDHPDTVITRNNLGYLLGVTGNLAEAVDDLQDALADGLRVLGPDHPDTLTIRHNLAIWKGQAGDPVRAVEELEDLLADRLRVLGPDHPDTLITRHNLAWFHGRAGDPVRAVEELEDLLADRLRVLGPDHPDTIATRNSLADWSSDGVEDSAGATRESKDV